STNPRIHGSGSRVQGLVLERWRRRPDAAGRNYGGHSNILPALEQYAPSTASGIRRSFRRFGRLGLHKRDTEGSLRDRRHSLLPASISHGGLPSLLPGQSAVRFIFTKQRS